MTVRSSVVGLGTVLGLVGGVAEWAAAQEQGLPQRPAAVILKAPQTPIVRRLAASDAIQTEWLGLALEPLSEVLAAQLGLKTGMVVDFLAADGPAQKAGLRKHDILLEANGTPIQAMSDLLQVVAVAAAEKKPVGLAVLRGGKPLEITVTPEPRPVAVTVIGESGGPAGEGQPLTVQSQAVFQANPGVIVGPRVQAPTIVTRERTGGLSEAETAAAIAELKKSIDELRAEIAKLAARGAAKD
jgi:membrane-associated protease RseP (regulator of RpoE activity)